MSLPADVINSLTKDQKHRIKTIEDRIEQSWKAQDIILSVNVINGIAGPASPPPMSEECERLLEDMAASVKHLGNALGVCSAEEMLQFDIDRNNIWSAVRRYGVATVLLFVNAQLVTNIEKFFSGVVVDYVTMFNKGQRAALPADKIFANNLNIKALHTRFYELRNEWYAHVERQDGRHILRYRVDKSNEIIIDKIGERVAPEYHLSEFANLYKCANHVLLFIDKDLDEKIAELMKTLTAPQKDILRRHWNGGNGSA